MTTTPCAWRFAFYGRFFALFIQDPQAKKRRRLKACVSFFALIRRWSGSRHVLGGHHVHAGAADVLQYHVADGDGGLDLDGAEGAGHVKDLCLGNLAVGADRQHRQGRALDGHGTGDGAHRRNALPAGVGVAAGTGVAGDGGHRAVFYFGGELAAHGAADADQLLLHDCASSTTNVTVSAPSGMAAGSMGKLSISPGVRMRLGMRLSSVSPA